jgi:hypothetical protein
LRPRAPDIAWAISGPSSNQLRDGLQVGQVTAFSQYRFDRRPPAHCFGKLGNQLSQHVAETHERRLPVGAADRLGNLEEAEGRWLSARWCAKALSR